MSNLTKGTLVDHYVIDNVLTQGGFAWAYFVHTSSDPTGPQYFLKELYPDTIVYRVGTTVQLIKPEYQKHLKICQDGFLKELNVLSSLNVPNIPKIIDAFEANNTFYIVQEKVDGVTLDKYFRQNIKDKGFESNRLLLECLIRLLQTLDGLHRFHKLHRDIKPSNILVSANGQPHLVDFGAARIEIDTVTYNVNERSVTPGFASYEQATTGAEQSSQGAASDLYSVAATFYFLLFNEKPVDAQLRVVKDEPVRDFKELSKSYDPGLLQTLNKAFMPLPNSRYQSAEEWLNDLNPLAEKFGLKYKHSLTEPEYQFEVGRAPSDHANIHRVVLNSSSRISGRHLEVTIVTKSDGSIDVTLNDCSSNGTKVIARTAQGEVVQQLISGQPVSLRYNSDVMLQLADTRIALRELIITYARECKASQIEKRINEIESGAQTLMMDPSLVPPIGVEPYEGKNIVETSLDDPQSSKKSLRHTLFSFDGRISRGVYWGVLLPTVFIGILLNLGVIFGGIAMNLKSFGPGGIYTVFALWTLPFIFFFQSWIGLAIGYKRLRHTGLSKGSAIALMLLALVPILGIVTGIIAGFVPENVFGEHQRGQGR